MTLLDQQVAYYRAVAREYGDHVLADASGGDALVAAVSAFKADGDVLELACGPGTWTPTLLKTADTVTALDASPEMIELARQATDGDARVTFHQVDLFEWQPERRYDCVFFGFWLSHVPSERFAEFFDKVDRALEPHGRVCFVDDGFITDAERIAGEEIQRTLNDGSTHRIVKVPLTAALVAQRLKELGWTGSVFQTTGPFFHGTCFRT